MRQSLYPLDASNGVVESILYDFYKHGLRPNGGTGKAAVDLPVEHYRFVRVKTDSNESITTIADKTIDIILHCQLHDCEFETNLRYMLNGSKNLKTKTCPHCNAKLPNTKTLHTVGSIKECFSKHPNAPLTVNFAKDRKDNEIIKTEKSIPMICTRTIIETGEPCNEKVEHKLGNALNLLTHPDSKGVICCQGSCDSKIKGKAKRKPFEPFLKELSEGTDGKWTFSDKGGQVYTVNNKSYWFKHTCSYEIFIPLYQLIKAEGNEGHHGCPYCDNLFSTKLINGDIELYQRWVDKITSSRLTFVDDHLPTYDRDTALYICNECNSIVEASISNICKAKYYCCETCNKRERKSLRVKVTDSQTEIRRGYRPDHEYHTVNRPVRFISHNNLPNFDGSLLELCREYPMTRLGYTHKSNIKPADKRHITERQYDCDDTAFSSINEKSAYFAGLLAADGCINHNKSGSFYISLELQALDEELLSQFLKFIECDKGVCYRSSTTSGHRNIYAGVQITSKQIAQDLEANFNIVSKKSLILKPPKLTDESHMKAYLLGLLDGDGSVKNYNRGLNALYTTASYEMALFIQEQMANIVGKENITNYERQSSESENLCYYVKATGKAAKIFLKALYDNCEIRMERKYRVYVSS